MIIPLGYNQTTANSIAPNFIISLVLHVRVFLWLCGQILVWYQHCGDIFAGPHTLLWRLHFVLEHVLGHPSKWLNPVHKNLRKTCITTWAAWLGGNAGFENLCFILFSVIWSFKRSPHTFNTSFLLSTIYYSSLCPSDLLLLDFCFDFVGICYQSSY